MSAGLPLLTRSLLPSVAVGLNGATPVAIPTYDRSALTGGIVHLGVGGFHRAHLALYVDDLAQAGHGSWSITGSGVMVHDARMADVLLAQDSLYLLAEREGTNVSPRIIGAITEVIPAHSDTSALIAKLSDASTRIVSLTITESGYPVLAGSFIGDDALAADIAADVHKTTFGVLVAALDARRKAGLGPFTVMSCDNLPGNGTVAKIGLLGAAALHSAELESWLAAHGAFPNAMVDRITPQTTDADRKWAKETFGFVDGWPVVCEPFRQWALEDHFVDGRPEFEKVGVLMADEVTVYEHMKLRLLNGSHSGLSYHAALAGIHYVHDAVLDHRIERFMRQFMKDEAAPNLIAPPGIDLVEYQNQLVQRFSNPAIADTIPRLCMDGTSKFPTFIVPSVEDQLAKNGPIEMLALIVAGWCRYLRGVADDGSALTLAHDPGLADAVDAANRSEGDPRAFLRLESALGPNIHQSDRFTEVFTRALGDLHTKGSLQTLEEWTRSS
jgi:mannitol 2-dehydrogenase